MTQTSKVELSEENRRLLESICSEFGSEQEAKEDPNFVLKQLLSEIERRKKKVSASLSLVLVHNLDPNVLKSRRKHMEEHVQ